MSHLISYGGNGAFWINNAGFSHLIDLMLEHGPRFAETDAEREDLQRLRDLNDEGRLWSGRCFDMEEDFLELKETDFWSRLLDGLAEDVLEHALGRDWPTARRLGMISCSHQWANFFAVRARVEKQNKT